MTFPPLRPTSWNVIPGTFAADVSNSGDGRTAIVRHSRYEAGGTWPAEFHLKDDEYQDLLDHFNACYGGMLRFNFDPDTLPTYYTPTGYQWIYRHKEQDAEDIAHDYHVVRIVFECVPPLGPGRAAGQFAYINLTTQQNTTIPWQAVQLLLPVNGDDDSSVIDDVSAYDKNVVSGAGVISSAQTIFGKKSITTSATTSSTLCTAEGLYTAHMPPSFVLEAQCYRPSSGPANQAIFQIGGTMANGLIYIYYLADHKIQLYQLGPSGVFLTSTVAVPTNQFYHFALFGYANGKIQIIINSSPSGIATKPNQIGNDGKLLLWGINGHYTSQVRLSFIEPIPEYYGQASAHFEG